MICNSHSLQLQGHTPGKAETSYIQMEGSASKNLMLGAIITYCIVIVEEMCFLICLSSIQALLPFDKTSLLAQSCIQQNASEAWIVLSPKNPQEIINSPQGQESLIPSWELPLERMISEEFRSSISSVSEPRGEKQR